MFMDALCSSATNVTKANPKKRKRLPSSSKDGSPPPVESPKITSAAPMKFYQDTLEDDKDEAGSPKKAALDEKDADKEREDAEKDSSPSSPGKDSSPAEPSTSEDPATDPSTNPASETPSSPSKAPSSPDQEPMDTEEADDATPKPPGPGCGPDGPPGVLVIHRRKGPKKSVRWRPQEQLEEVRLFELDETERVNVTKTFTDMKQMERFGERDAFQMARKLQADDVMVEQTPWTRLLEVDDVPQAPLGLQSKEREVQAQRELSCLQALYFSYAMIPDSAAEPDAETYKYAEPALIPLEDAQNTVNDFTKQGWPEPKEAAAHGANPFGAFDNSPFGPFNMQGPFPGQGGANPGIWAGAPPFVGGPGGGPGGVVPPFGGINNEEIKMAMNRLAFPPGQNFPPNFNGINMLNLPAMGAGGPMGGGPNGPNGPPPGGWGFRGPPPGGVWRGHGPPGVNNGGGPPMMGMGNGGGPRGWMNGNPNGRICKNIKKGFCKKGDKCNFVHPNGGFNRM